MSKTLTSLVLAGLSALSSTSCTYLHPKGKPIYDSMPDSINQNDGRYSIPAINISNLGWVQPELSDRVAEGEFSLKFKPFKDSKIVKDRFEGKDWYLETSNIYVTPVYMVGTNKATEVTFEIGGRHGITVDLTKPDKNGYVRVFDQSDHKYTVPTMLIDTDRDPKTPKVEFYIPVVRNFSGTIIDTLLIEADKAKEVIDFGTGQLTLRTAPGDIHYFKEISSAEYILRPVTTAKVEKVSEEKEETISPTGTVR